MTKRVITLAEYYGISIKEFEKLGVLNPNLNENTLLFIDPTCLKDSKYKLFNTDARLAYEEYFQDFYEQMKLHVILSPDLKETSKKNLIKKLCHKEIVGLCLGYSDSGKSGSGIGPKAAERILDTAERLFSNNLDNPAIFSLIPLLTVNIGPDFISDMTARIILPQLLNFTDEMATKLNIPVFKTSKIKGKNYNLPKHPFVKGYILLVPDDILNPLPLEVNLEDVFNGYSPSDEIRYRVNEDVANILKIHKKAQDRKKHLEKYLLNHKDIMNDLANYVKNKKSAPYNFKEDPLAVYFSVLFRELIDCTQYKIEYTSPAEIIDNIINNFKKKIDTDNNIKRELLWYNGKARKEKSWQQAFHLFIFETLSANNIDVTPEAETGYGPVDFKFSKGNNLRVLIEIKLSKNNPIKGLEKQLEKYKECTQNLQRAYFICFDVEEDLQKSQKMRVELFKRKRELKLNTEIIFIDGRINPSASNL